MASLGFMLIQKRSDGVFSADIAKSTGKIYCDEVDAERALLLDDLSKYKQVVEVGVMTSKEYNEHIS